MANPKVLLKRSSISGRVPGSSDLSYGELALNYTDGVIYYKNSSNKIRSIAGGIAGGLDSDAVLGLAPFTLGYKTSTITIRQLEVALVDGNGFSNNYDAFGVLIGERYDTMEPVGRIETLDCGALS